MNRRSKRARERGTALMVTLIIIASLLAGGAVVVSMQLGSNRDTDLARSGMTAVYCAEEGIERAGPVVAANYAAWNGSLCGSASEANCVPPASTPVLGGSAEAPIFEGINHSITGSGTTTDFVLYLRDDNDEPGSASQQNLGSDSNMRVFIVSTCLKFPDTPKQVKELVTYNGGGYGYKQQNGGVQGVGNSN